MLKDSKLPAIVCEAGFSENWDKLMEDTRLWLLCTGGETKIVFVLSFTEQNSTSDPAADPNQDFVGAMNLRDPEFEEYHRAYMATTKPDELSEKAPEDKVR